MMRWPQSRLLSPNIQPTLLEITVPYCNLKAGLEVQVAGKILVSNCMVFWLDLKNIWSLLVHYCEHTVDF
jgi:hypothetical protein